MKTIMLALCILCIVYTGHAQATVTLTPVKTSHLSLFGRNQDKDKDGYKKNQGDCDDNNAAVHPGATEQCNGIDDNCDGTADEGLLLTWYADDDSDGFGNALISTVACTAPAGFVDNSGDCNDQNHAVYPGSAEICNSIDDDCDGPIDEGLAVMTWFLDNDNDGAGNSLISITTCSGAVPGYVANGIDCNDDDPLVQTNQLFFIDADRDGSGSVSTLICASFAPEGYSLTGGDCNDLNAAVHAGAVELFNNIDDNCDGQVDEGFREQITINTTDNIIGKDFMITSTENGFCDNKNNRIDVTGSVFTGHLADLGGDYQYPGSSGTHSVVYKNYLNTSAYGGIYFQWGTSYITSTKCLEISNTPIFVDGAILDGLNCVNYNVSFTKQMIDICRQYNASLVLGYNANENDLKSFMQFVRDITSQGVNIIAIEIGAELDGRNYSNAGDFKDGNDYVNRVVNPLCDSIEKFKPSVLTVAWPSQFIGGSNTSWNNYVKSVNCKAEALNIYALGTYLGSMSAGTWTPQRRLDSINKWLSVNLWTHLDRYKALGKLGFIHQWNPNWKEVSSTFLDVVATSTMFSQLLSYDASRTDYLKYVCYNGWTRQMNMQNQVASGTYYALDNCYEGIKEGSKLCTFFSSELLKGTATTDGSYYYVNVWNTTPNPVRVDYLRIDGNIYSEYTTKNFIIASGLDDTRYSIGNVIDKTIPAYSDGVLVIRK